MAMSGFLRRLRGALGTAFTWAVSWSVGSAALAAVAYSFGLPAPIPLWQFALMVGINSAVPGFLAGAGFSVFLGVVGRNKRLDQLSALRLGLGGALTAGIIVPAFSGLTAALAGFILPLWILAGSAPTAAIIGGATAFGTIKIAQAGERRLAEPAWKELEGEQAEVDRLLT